METLLLVMPPAWLVRAALAGVWGYEGLWCKILGRATNELRIVQAVPHYGPKYGRAFLLALGWVELLLAVWALSGWTPGWCWIAPDAAPDAPVDAPLPAGYFGKLSQVTTFCPGSGARTV